MRNKDMSPTLRIVPHHRETDVPRDATLLVAAPRPLDHRSTGSVSVRTEDRDIDGVIDISSDGRMLFWRPVQALEPQAEHHVRICGVRDSRGEPFDDVSSSFVTGLFSYPDLSMPSD